MTKKELIEMLEDVPDDYLIVFNFDRDEFQPIDDIRVNNKIKACFIAIEN